MAMNRKTLAFCAAVLCVGPTLTLAQPITDPAAFAAVAGSSNMFEIESSEIALDKATNDAVRQFAQQMVDDHTAAGEKMKAAAEADGVTPPAGLAEKEQAELEKLQAAEGADFDAAYVLAQVAAHDEAVALFQSFSENGQESALRGFAAETLPTLEEHRSMVDDLAGTH
jgi:putative membrane protein